MNPAVTRARVLPDTAGISAKQTTMTALQTRARIVAHAQTGSTHTHARVSRVIQEQTVKQVSTSDASMSKLLQN
ncbi:hypothetical protein MAR_018618, partial [Mya arenaria]